MAKSKKSRSKNRLVKVDMQGIETSVLVPEGDYSVEVEEVSLETSDNSGKQYLSWKFKVKDEESNAKSLLFYNTSLQPQALFNLKNVLISLGVTVPNSTLKLDLEELEGLSCGVTVEHEVFEGRKKSRIVDFFPLDEKEDEKEEDEEDEEDEGEEESSDNEEVDLDSMSFQEMLNYIEEEELDLGLSKKDMKKKTKVKAALKEALDLE